MEYFGDPLFLVFFVKHHQKKDARWVILTKGQNSRGILMIHVHSLQRTFIGSGISLPYHVCPRLR